MFSLRLSSAADTVTGLVPDPGGSILVGLPPGNIPARTTAQPPAASAPVAREAFQLVVEGRLIPLQPGLQLELGKLPGFAHGKGIILAVTIHPTDPSILGLQNLGLAPWTAIHDGKSRQIDPKKNIRIAHGTLIAFGPVQGSIHRVTT